MAKALTKVTSSAPTGLVGAICAITSTLTPITKNATNDFHKYRYVTMPDLLKVLAPLMAQHQITVFQSEVSSTMVDGNVLRIEYEFEVTHGPSGENRKIKASGLMKVTGNNGGYNDRACQAIATTTRKYMLIALFNAVIDDPIDVDASVPDKRPKTLTKHEASPIFMKLSEELDQVANLGDLDEYGNSHGLTIAQLPGDWQRALRIRYAQKLAQFKPPANVTPITPTISQKAMRARFPLNDELPDHCK